MATFLQLNEFFISKLSIDHFEIPQAEQGKDIETSLGINYHLEGNSADRERFRLKLIIGVSPSVEPKKGYEIGVEVVGYFSFRPEKEDESSRILFLINGCSILYGILRGYIGTVTGTCTGGKFNLPSVSFVDVIREIENQKLTLEQTHEPVQEQKKKTRTRRNSLKS